MTVKGHSHLQSAMTGDGVTIAKKMPIACGGWGLEKAGTQVRTEDP